MTFLHRISLSRPLFKIVTPCLLLLMGLYAFSTLNIRMESHGTVCRPGDACATRDKKTFPFTIVTASSANHLCALENFLYSLQDLKTELNEDEFPRIVVYNIGFNRTQLPVVNQLVTNGLIDDLVMFDYFRYPRFWDVSLNAGEYAWKTGIVNEVRLRYEGVVLWLDAGNVVTSEFLRHIPSMIRDNGGFWSPRSESTMGRWTYHDMFTYFGVDRIDYARKPNCNGAAVGFDTSNQTIVDSLILPWFMCGLDRNCIAPPGSSRKNHRQDQAALTLLAYQHGFGCHVVPNRFNLHVHRDVSCRTSLLERSVIGTLHHPSTLDMPAWDTSIDTAELSLHPEWRYPVDQVPANVDDLLLPLDDAL